MLLEAWNRWMRRERDSVQGSACGNQMLKVFSFLVLIVRLAFSIMLKAKTSKVFTRGKERDTELSAAT